MKKETFSSVFNDLCEQYHFRRDGSSAKREFEKFDLYVNLQKSVYGKRFFINVIILYHEMLEDKIEFNFTEIFGVKAPFWPHVNFRIECLTEGDGVDQKLFDDLTMNKDWVSLKVALEKCFEKLIFLSESGELERSNIRNLEKSGLISGMIISKV